jgi:hypothetical protein
VILRGRSSQDVNGRIRLLLRGGCWLLTAGALVWAMQSCGTRLGHPESRLRQEQSFSGLWTTYNRCQTAEEPEALLMDAIELNRAAQRHMHPDPPPLLKPFTSPLPVRLAVDPTVMAHACALKAAQAAATRGWNDVAVVLYQSVIPDQLFEGDVSVYALQAKAGLADVLKRSPDASVARFRLLSDVLSERRLPLPTTH